MDSERMKIVKESLNNNETYFKFYMRQKYVDTVIKCSNGVVKAHSCVIENNNVFNNLLSLLRNNDIKELDLSRFSTEVMRVVIEYIYREDSKYFREIGQEIKGAIEYFFNDTESTVTKADTNSDSLIEIQEVDVETIALSDSEDNETFCENVGKAVVSTDAKSRVTEADANSNSIIEVQEIGVKTIVLSDSENNETICEDVEKAKKSTASPPRTKGDCGWILPHRKILSPPKKCKNPVVLAQTLTKNSHKGDKNECHNLSQSGTNLASSQMNKKPIVLAKAERKNSNEEDRNKLRNSSHSRNKPTSNPVSCSQLQHHEESDEEVYCNIISDSAEEKREKVPEKFENLSQTRQNPKLNNKKPIDIVYDSTDDEDSVTMQILRDNRRKTKKRKPNCTKITFQVVKLDGSQLPTNNNDSIRRNNVQDTSRCTEIDANSENPAPIQKIIVHKSTVINKPRTRDTGIGKSVENSTLIQKYVTTITNERTNAGKKNKFLENPALVISLKRLPSVVSNKCIHVSSDEPAVDLEHPALENTLRNEELPTSPLNEKEATENFSLQESPNLSLFSIDTSEEDENDESNKHIKRNGKAGNIKTT